MMEKIPMTAAGHVRLEDELKTLKTIERPAIIRAIAEAREHGDLSENAEYHAAREKQSFIEGRIQLLEATISRADIIDISKFKGSETIKFGATITLYDEEIDEEMKYQIVGAEEADLKHGKLSLTAPISRALMGKKVGDTIEVVTPKGKRAYDVVAVDYL
jgi:transcription elongation factor GreA